MEGPIPIAIIGMGFRGPGGASDPEKLWDMLKDGKSAWSEVPSDRWNAKSFYHPDIHRRDANNHKGGHFIKADLAEFDAAFFGIQGSEAAVVDPQQRILLEITYEAFENAGIPMEDVKGSDTSVFIACFVRDYEMNIFKDSQGIPPYTMTGTGTGIIANRVSYNFDLRGASFALDTGCSGSLVALHQACQNLRARESSMAVVGGTNLLIGPDVMQAMSLSRVLNDDGKCYTFDNRGSGYGRGEGVASVVIKRLDDAVAAGDPIRAIIRNTGINQDGKTAGITLPNQNAQEDLIRSTYSAVGLDPKDTGYVEAHGTGTVAGDTIEVAAIANTFTNNGARGNELYVGSVKTSLGHLESASGIAGLIKTVLAMERGVIPPHLNFEKPKDGLNLEERKIKLALAATPFPESVDGIRRASVNSFGYGGTNAHVILDSAPPTAPRANGTNGHKTNGHHYSNETTNGATNGTLNGRTVNTSSAAGTPKLFVISAKTQKSLIGSVETVKNWVAGHPGEAKLSSLANTLLTRRSLMQWRSSFVASSNEELIAKLGEPNFHVSKEAPESRLVFLFTGQGAQWYAMGRELISTHSAFQESILKSEKLLTELGAEWNLTDVLLQEEKDSLVDRSDLSQPVSTALQLALVDLLDSLNVKPQAVIGHSSGEIAAAYCAGALSHTAAMTVSYRRGFTAEAVKRVLKSKGAMLAVGLGEVEVMQYIVQVKSGKVTVACVNSPKSTTISGDAVAIEELKLILDACEESIFSRKLKVDTAYHSHHMAAVSDEYLQSLTGLEAKEPRADVKFFSSVTGAQKKMGFGPSYWVDNLLGQVKFSDALQNLCESQHGVSNASTSHLLIEIGAHAALSGPIRQTLTHQNLESFKHIYLSTLLRNQNAISTMLDLTGRLFESGYNVNLKAAMGLTGSHHHEVVSDLAPYSWDHSSTYWSESRISKEHRLRQHANHDILGLRIINTSLLEPAWRNILSIETLPWLRDHVVDDMIVYPGAGYMCMALEAVRQINYDRQVPGKAVSYRMRDVAFSKALVIPDPGNVEVQLTLRPAVNDRGSSTWEAFKVMSRSENGTWSEHFRGSIMTEFESAIDEVEGAREAETREQMTNTDRDELKKICTTKLDAATLYTSLQANGNTYGETFAAVKELNFGDCKAIAIVQTPDVAACMPYKFMSQDPIHPTTLDAVFHIDVALFNQYCGAKGVMPIALGEVFVSADFATPPGEELIVTSVLHPEGSRAATFDCQVSQGPNLIISVKNGELRAIGQAQESVKVQTFDTKSCYEIKWSADVDFVPQEVLTTSPSISGSSLSPVETMTLLDTVATLYIKQFMDELEENFSPTESHQVALLQWMKKYRTSDEFQVLVTDAPPLETCLEKLKGSGPGIELLSRIGPNLRSILASKVDALSIMMEGDLLTRFYASDMLALQCYEHMAEYLKLAVFKNPHMKVLEVGAGIGSATLPLLKAITHEHGVLCDGFTFTDASSASFERVQPMLEEWSDIIDYKTLNIEQDPALQEFTEGTYDIFVASLALHATSSISQSLENVRKLLKPGGRLVLIELTRVTAWVNCIFGSVPGWWAGVEGGRVGDPLLSVEEWGTALKAAGFGGFEVATDVLDHRASMMISTISPNGSAPLQNGNAKQTTVNILTADTVSENTVYKKFSEDLCSGLEQGGFASNLAPWPVHGVDVAAIYVVLDDGARPMLVDPTPEKFKQITRLLTTTSVLWISAQTASEHNPEKGLLVGLERVARAESGSSKFQCIDVQQNITESCPALIKTITSLVSSAHRDSPYLTRGIEPEYIYRDSMLLLPRCVPSAKFNGWVQNNKEKLEMAAFRQPGRPMKLHVETPGLLDSMMFVDDPAAQVPLDPNELEFETRAFGINFKDVYVALGQMKASDRIVGECSGVITRVGSNLTDKFNVGDRICAWYATPFASYARVTGLRAYVLPDSLSFAEGASIPIVFMTAYHGLIDIARLRKGQSVLIHAATGGVGQAAIQIAQHVGAEIFVTVGSVPKRQIIVEQFGIPESHIFSSRARNFKAGILRLTKGKGVDVVLNSLSGEALSDSWSCIGRLGTFIEIGKTDIYQNAQLSMMPFSRTVTFAAFDLSVITEERPEDLVEIMSKVLTMFQAGILRPARPINQMPITEIEDAFRLIQARKHTGKVVLEAAESTLVKSLTIAPPPRLDDRGTFVIAGGLGDLGKNISRFLARHGAKHIVALSRSSLEPAKAMNFSNELLSLGAELHPIICDITNLEQVQKAALFCTDTLPPVKSIIQAAMVLRDGVLEAMNVGDFSTAVDPKVRGTRYLAESFPKVDSFVMFSSATSIVGNRGQGNYAAGCSYQDAVANNQTSGTHFVSLNLPLIAGSDVDIQNPGRQQSMYRQGVVPITMDELFTVLDYALSPRCREDGITQILVGLSGQALKFGLDQFGSTNPMFNHLMTTKGSNASGGETFDRTNAHIGITADLSTEEVYERMTTAIANRLSALVAVEYSEIELDTPILDFGLDSLVAIELKNWITRTFQTTTIDTSEILGMPGIRALAKLTAERSSLVNGKPVAEQQETAVAAIRGDLPTHNHKCCKRAKKLPVLPLLDLETLFQYHLANHRAIWTDEEYENTVKAAQEFQKPGGIGQKLYARLLERKNSPDYENWMYEIATRTIYLDRRYSLLKSNIGISHKLLDEGLSHTQSERAAVIALATFKFKQTFEADEMEPDYVNEVPLCMRGHEWLFQTCREPRIDVDTTNKFPSNSVMVVMHRGHVFKVGLEENGETVSYSKLKATFEAILGAPKEESWMSILTTAERNNWARVYETMKLDPDNKASIETIESSAFIICLDDSSPVTPEERMDRFLLGDGFNKWYDKTVEFIVCSNGASGFLGEHSMVDGSTMASINSVIVRAILDHTPDAISNGFTPMDAITFEECPFNMTPFLQEAISNARALFFKTVAPVRYRHEVFPFLGATQLESHRLPPKYAWEIVVQLAARLFFGFSPASWQPVAMEQYHQGRPDIVQVATPIVVAFCDAAVAKIPPGGEAKARREQRKLFFKSVKDHANAVARAQRGHAHDRTFTALEWVRVPGEEDPTLFASDVGYFKSRPRFIMTGMKMELFSEIGFVLTDPESVWLVYEVGNDGARFSIVNAGGKAEEFCRCIDEAGKIVQAFLD